MAASAQPARPSANGPSPRTFGTTLGTAPWFGSRLRVSGAANVFDANGTLVDEKIREQLGPARGGHFLRRHGDRARDSG